MASWETFSHHQPHSVAAIGFLILDPLPTGLIEPRRETAMVDRLPEFDLLSVDPKSLVDIERTMLIAVNDSDNVGTNRLSGFGWL